MLDKALVSWLRVLRTPNIGPISFYSLHNRFADPGRAIDFLQKTKSVPTEQSILEEIEKTHTFGARFLFFQDTDYPPLLRHIRDAPPFLIAKGNMLKGRGGHPSEGHSMHSSGTHGPMQCIAIVGSRNSSMHGGKIAHNLAEDLVECGYTIVSGLARGIDRHAHLGGMKSTIAVIANGIDQIYPSENKDIYNKIIDTGMILTEAPIGTPPASHLFPGRNRIIAGLSLGTVVVEATKHSGSLITAQYSVDYDREVFGVPGCPLDPRSYGPNTLIQSGACLIQNHQDILQQLGYIRIREDDVIPEESLPAESNILAEELLLNQLLELISTSPIAIDDIHSNFTHSNSEYNNLCTIGLIRKLLVEMEIAGQIQHLPGDKVVRIYS